MRSLRFRLSSNLRKNLKPTEWCLVAACRDRDVILGNLSPNENSDRVSIAFSPDLMTDRS